MIVISPPLALRNLSARMVVKLCTLGGFALGVSLVSCIVMISVMCVVHNQFELIEFAFVYVYADLHYDKIYLTFTAGSVSLCYVCGHVVIFGLSMRLLWYTMWMRWLL